jgi:integrase
VHGFFAWCGTTDLSTNRPFTFSNPVETIRKFTARQVREEQEATLATTSIDDLLKMFSALMRWKNGVLVRPFALLYFAGIRPYELNRLAGREDELINLKTGVIHIPANVSKTKHPRQIDIPENLATWLKAYPEDLIPKNFGNLNKKARKHYKLAHDEQRHSFISYHVALHRSIGDAALQAGNSESIVKRHYLNVHTREEGSLFSRIMPDLERRRAIIAPEPEIEVPSHLKAV